MIVHLNKIIEHLVRGIKSESAGKAVCFYTGGLGHSEAWAQGPLAFNILISPAINWLEQGAYNSRQQMAKDGYTAERWSFVSQNFLTDAADDLHKFKSPVLLLLDEEDLNIDVQQPEQVYREKIRLLWAAHCIRFFAYNCPVYPCGDLMYSVFSQTLREDRCLYPPF